MGEMILDYFNLLAESRVHAREDGLEHAVDDSHHLMVITFDGHLEIQTGVFGEMAMCVAVLSAEDWTNLKHAPKVGADSQLLRQLRALRQEGIAVEIVDLEDLGAGLGRGWLEFGRVDFHEAFGLQPGTPNAADEGLHTEDSLCGRGAEKCQAVGDADAIRCERLPDRGAALGVVDELGAIDGVDIYGQCIRGRHNHVYPLNQNLHITHSASADGLSRCLENTLNVHEALREQVLSPSNHPLGNESISREKHPLECLDLLAQDDKGKFGAHVAHMVKARGEGNPGPSLARDIVQHLG